MAKCQYVCGSMEWVRAARAAVMILLSSLSATDLISG